ncbi:hypothetical protein [Maribacter sp. R77961]|uniref:hypothetical protein n=1 Tax=Maribacter sp. R77961 TaxID=3093871 RepID=UPI0037C592EA
MKKLLLLGVFAMASFSIMAKDAQEVEVSIVVENTEIVNDDFSEIDVAQLPTAVTEAVRKNYPTSTINKAYINESKQYKLEVSLEDGTSGTLYADEHGNWLDM